MEEVKGSSRNQLKALIFLCFNGDHSSLFDLKELVSVGSLN